MKTLHLVKVADNGVYRLQHEYFRDEDTLLLWRNEGRIGDRPLRLNYCEPSGEPSGPIWGDICRVTVDGVDTPFCKWDRRAWQWERCRPVDRELQDDMEEESEMNMNDKTAAGLTLDEPAVTEIEHWKAYTDGNQHTAVRIVICKWLAKNLTRNGIDEGHEIVAINKTLTALDVINRELGHMPGELSELRSKTTSRMLALAGRYSLEVAETIRKAL